MDSKDLLSAYFLYCACCPGCSLFAKERLRCGSILLGQDYQGIWAKAAQWHVGTLLRQAECLWSKWRVLFRKLMEAMTIEVAPEGRAALTHK